jgi:hypothetical protein
MDTQVKVTYEIEVIAPSGNQFFVTNSRDEALDFYEKGHLVFETHHTITTFSLFNQSHLIAIKRWNNNPEFEEGNNNDT